MGEFGAADNTTCLNALDNMLQNIGDNSDVWVGWTYWAAGRWWGDYMFSVHPSNDHTTDKPQLPTLKKHAGANSLPPDPDPDPPPPDPPPPDPANEPPTASFAEPLDGQTYPAGVGLTVIVNAADSDGSIAHVSLFVNGAFLRTEFNPPYRWQPSQDAALVNMSAAPYTFRAVALDNDGATTEASISIIVMDDVPPPPPPPPPDPENSPPIAGFNFAIADLTVSFTDTSTDSDGSIVAWAWDFGDGTTSMAQNPSHTYSHKGNGSHTITLTVVDNEGATATVQKAVRVKGRGRKK